MAFEPNLTPAGWDPKITTPPGTDVAALVQAAVAGAVPTAVAAAVPSAAATAAATAAAGILGDTKPMPESMQAKAGALPKAARLDHEHPSPRSVTGAVLDANGEATVMFTQAFEPVGGVGSANPYPGLVCFYTEQNEVTPITAWKAKSWIPDANGNFIGVVIKAYRGRPLPVQAALSGSLLTIGPLIAALNTILAGLSGYDVTGGSAANVAFTCIAVRRTTTTT